MKNLKRTYFALLVGLFLISGSQTLCAQAAQQSGDQSQTDSTKKKTKKKKAGHLLDQSRREVLLEQPDELVDYHHWNHNE